MYEIQTSSTNVSITVSIFDDSGLPVTGLLAATFPSVYWTTNSSTRTQITLADLSAITDAHSDGGVFEIGDGDYRLDLPDTVFAAAGQRKITGEATDKRLLAPPILVKNLPNVDSSGKLILQDNAISSSVMANDAISAASVSTGAVSKIQSGIATTSALNTVDSNVDSIKAKTDNLTFTGTDVHCTLDGEGVVVSDKTGFSLASTGLDSISVADPASGDPSTWIFPQYIKMLRNRFFNKVVHNSNTGDAQVFADDGTTVICAQTWTTSSGVETQSEGS